MSRCNLTEKNMANKKFRKRELAISAAYFTFEDQRTSKAIAKRAGVSRSTLFRHHGSIQNIPQNYEDYLLSIFIDRINHLSDRQNNLPLKTTYFHTLIFISNHKKEFKGLFNDGHKDIIKKMLDVLKPIIASNLYYLGSADKIYNIYENEVLGVIETWDEHNYSITKLKRVLNDILYLTETAPKHLTPLIETN